MRFKPLLLLPLFGVALLAEGILIKNLSLPIFDETGLLTKTLTAESAAGPLTRPVLKSGVITFHTATGDKITSGSTLTFADAIYDKTDGFLVGDGPIRFASTTGDLSGVGFHYDINTGRLKLHHAVLFEFKEGKHRGVKVHGKKADALIRQNPAGQAWVIAEALVTGPVVATEVTIQKVRFDKVDTAQANYSGADETITLASPVTGWRGEKQTVLGAGLIQYQLDPAPSADPVPASASKDKTP